VPPLTTPTAYCPRMLKERSSCPCETSGNIFGPLELLQEKIVLPAHSETARSGQQGRATHRSRLPPSFRLDNRNWFFTQGARQVRMAALGRRQWLPGSSRSTLRRGGAPAGFGRDGDRDPAKELGFGDGRRGSGKGRPFSMSGGWQADGRATRSAHGGGSDIMGMGDWARGGRGRLWHYH